MVILHSTVNEAFSQGQDLHFGRRTRSRSQTSPCGLQERETSLETLGIGMAPGVPGRAGLGLWPFGVASVGERKDVKGIGGKGEQQTQAQDPAEAPGGDHFEVSMRQVWARMLVWQVAGDRADDGMTPRLCMSGVQRFVCPIAAARISAATTPFTT